MEKEEEEEEEEATNGHNQNRSRREEEEKGGFNVNAVIGRGSTIQSCSNTLLVFSLSEEQERRRTLFRVDMTLATRTLLFFFLIQYSCCFEVAKRESKNRIGPPKKRMINWVH
ncbi:hypothetical protein CRE_23932 [Caenorhabditis remanei]|uniref:Uncharacterized protein n=1 Tax=Caenorhabditis remanei TaxID=31234 RepID=E3MGI5_CAERE|nr:hypothetical protein CRE_23932 [Caenorhabditis remanei]